MARQKWSTPTAVSGAAGTKSARAKRLNSWLPAWTTADRSPSALGPDLRSTMSPSAS
ncbi:MAG: hypothetical protein Q7W02_10675 [Candidatus Rokubacteria bacterium]|nr:hypothetical protein [Candidatus Rokubacteria bacterium]